MLLSHEGDNMTDPLAQLQEQLRKDQKLLDAIKAQLPALEAINHDAGIRLYGLTMHTVLPPCKYG